MKIDQEAQKFGHVMLSFLQHFQRKLDLIKAKADIGIQNTEYVLFNSHQW